MRHELPLKVLLSILQLVLGLLLVSPSLQRCDMYFWLLGISGSMMVSLLLFCIHFSSVLI